MKRAARRLQAWAWPLASLLALVAAALLAEGAALAAAPAAAPAAGATPLSALV
ncbi:MAG: hypothetical protein KF683_21095 [Rubrivivax sp.]|nr:hypothetical protein [Rubrivivax sp.]